MWASLEPQRWYLDDQVRFPRFEIFGGLEKFLVFLGSKGIQEPLAPANSGVGPKPERFRDAPRSLPWLSSAGREEVMAL
jgi:hypothetical protein